jgi:hypothetical protein
MPSDPWILGIGGIVLAVLVYSAVKGINDKINGSNDED